MINNNPAAYFPLPILLRLNCIPSAQPPLYEFLRDRLLLQAPAGWLDRSELDKINDPLPLGHGKTNIFTYGTLRVILLERLLFRPVPGSCRKAVHPFPRLFPTVFIDIRQGINPER